MPARPLRTAAAALTALVVVGACTTPAEQWAARQSSAPPATTMSSGSPGASAASPPPTAAPPRTTTPPSTTTAAPQTPEWVVGASPLPLRPDGFGQILPTPPELVNRALPTRDLLPPPADGRFSATVDPVPDAVLARSTWQPRCPVGRGDLRYLTLSFWGFDGRAHTGEMLVHASVAEDVAAVFERLFAVRFPIEEMRVTARPELDLHPTGDGNNTTAFVCRPAVNLTTWSAHASGLAIDVNPFCNPYIKGNLVLPELASSYVDRQDVRPGMVVRGDAVVRAFSAVGWTWGGDWHSPIDLQHFTATGR